MMVTKLSANQHLTECMHAVRLPEHVGKLAKLRDGEYHRGLV
jgi:hypothetical protein